MDGEVRSYVRDGIKESIKAKELMLDDNAILDSLEEISNQCVLCFQRGNKVLLAGNGGSAADAQHIAAEFVSRFDFDRPGLSAIALTVDTSILTAIGNDYGFEKIFSRQLESYAKNGDIFIAISTSGSSKNIINALKACQDLGVITIGLCGNKGGMLEYCDYGIAIPSQSTPRIQECHILVGHLLCGSVEKSLFQGKI
jgi:D-sedoheptulose 7-phosphate isomerase